MKNKKNIYKKSLIFMMIAALMSACTERIDVELDDTYTRLVVDGQITSEDSVAHKVILTKTTSYFYNQPPPPVQNADVSISDGSGNTTLLAEDEPGVYYLPQGFKAESGETYAIDIRLEEAIDGQTVYTASTSTPAMGDTVWIDLKYEPDWGDDGYYVVECYYWDPLGPNWYLFDIYKNGVLLTDTITEKSVTDDTFYDGNFTNGIGVGYLDQSRQDEKVRPGDVITFRASSITEGYYNFVWQVQTEVGYSTPLFSGPPANVDGNLSDGAIGYFTAYPVMYASTVVE